LAWGFAAVAALVAAQAPLRAQDAQTPANETGTVGPRELEDFSINGTVTQPAPQRPAPTAPATRPQPPAQQPAAERPAPPSASPAETVSTDAERDRPASPAREERAATSTETQPLRQTAPASSVTVALPGLDSQGEASAAAQDIQVPDAPSGEDMLLWPWLLAAVAAAAATGVYFNRGRLQSALAGGAEAQAFEAPSPPPRPAPPPVAPRKLAPRHDPTPKTPAPVAAPTAEEPLKGFVSTRLRPWIELGFDASRCVVENDKVTIDFEIEMINSGNAPARGVLVEARLVNAGPGQDSEIGQFFAHPVGQGERIDSIAPLKNVRIKSRIVTPLSNVQVLDVAGRKVFVPLIAFNILYGWARGTGQTSASYLVGRDTKSDKMAPFRLDLGPRLFRSLAQAPLPIAVRQ
jgi:hypothetical protein